MAALTWTDWRNHGEELRMLREAYPAITDAQLEAGFRLLDHAGVDLKARSEVLRLLAGCDANAREEGDG